LGIDAQLILMNGPEARFELWWMALAISSLPVPFSPLNEDVRVARRHALDQLEQLLHHAALPDHVGKAVLPTDLLAQVLMLGALFVPIRGLSEEIDETVLRHGLLEKEERAGTARLDGTVDRALAADDDRLGLRVDLFQLLEELDPIDVRQSETGQHDVRPPVSEDLFAGLTAEGGADFIAFSFNDLSEPVSGGRLIVNRQYAPAALAVWSHWTLKNREPPLGYHTVCNLYTQP
jgi:hypothetical protein